MFTQFLINLFIKDKDTNKRHVRRRYGYFGGIVGIIVNALLFLFKLISGLLVNSIAIIADAFNNLSDVGSSFVTIFGFKLSSKPPDKEHPYGHGRMEYLSGVIVAIFVIIVGVQFLTQSIKRIIDPLPVQFSIIPIIILAVSILVKLWLGFFNRRIGKTIHSNALIASGIDAFSDVVSSLVILLSYLVGRLTTIPLDGVMGVIVSLIILYAGYGLIKDTMDPLLGAAPDKELVETIQRMVMEYPLIMGVHDLLVHNYGPGRMMASIHAEVPADVSIVKMHDIVDQAEQAVFAELGVILVIHVDPVFSEDEDFVYAKGQLNHVLTKFPKVINYHDFRLITKQHHKQLIFDVVVEPGHYESVKDQDNLQQQITSALQKNNPHFIAIITVDQNFIGTHYEHPTDEGGHYH